MTTPYFEIGVINSKTPANVGTLWRTGYQLGAEGIFTIGKRYTRQPTDVSNVCKKIAYRNYPNFEEMLADRVYECPIIAVEMGGEDLTTFQHPDQAIYLLGAEDFGIPSNILTQCHATINIPSIRLASYNLAVAGALVLYDRARKQKQF